MSLITLVVPAYNEEQSIRQFYEAVKAEISTIHNYEFEFLFINDGSSDNTLKVLKALRESDRSVCYLSLSANRGKEVAMLAGFDHVNPDSEAIIIMDSDLQHPPKYIKIMLNLMNQGFDDVYGIRKQRIGEPALKKFFSKIYYKILSNLSNIKVEGGVGDFRLLRMNVVSSLRKMREKQRYTKGLFTFVGYKKTSFEYISEERVAGQTKWGFLKLLELALDGILSFSTKPLRIATILGILFSSWSFLYAVYFVIKTLTWGEAVQGFPTLVFLILFLGGSILFCLGIIGEYIGRIYIEIKNRPSYFIEDEKLNHER